MSEELRVERFPGGSPFAEDHEWLRGQLARFTYRPGWRMRIRGWPLDPALEVSHVARDADNPEAFTQQSPRVMVPAEVAACRDEAMFAAWLASVLESLEVHESHEWLRRDGVRVTDPHGPIVPDLLPRLVPEPAAELVEDKLTLEDVITEQLLEWTVP